MAALGFPPISFASAAITADHQLMKSSLRPAMGRSPPWGSLLKIQVAARLPPGLEAPGEKPRPAPTVLGSPPPCPSSKPAASHLCDPTSKATSCSDHNQRRFSAVWDSHGEMGPKQTTQDCPPPSRPLTLITSAKPFCLVDTIHRGLRRGHNAPSHTVSLSLFCPTRVSLGFYEGERGADSLKTNGAQCWEPLGIHTLILCLVWGRGGGGCKLVQPLREVFDSRY